MARKAKKPAVPLKQRLPHLAMKMLFVFFLVATLATSINYNVLLSHMGRGSAMAPSVPSVDKATEDQAAASAPGQKLKEQGFSPSTVIADQGIITWLDGEQTNVAKVTNPGPYVLFSDTTSEASKPDPSIPPEVIVDKTAQVIVGLYQAYSNGRGAACYTSGDPRELATAWVSINNALWGKSLGEDVMLSSDDVPQLPPDMPTVACHTFKS